MSGQKEGEKKRGKKIEFYCSVDSVKGFKTEALFD